MDALIPDAFRAVMHDRLADGDEGMTGETWLKNLPQLLREACEEWGLRLDGDAKYGNCALVFPVRRGTERLAFKMTWPHADARFEHLALRAWRGTASVRLIAADPSRWTLLLERLEPASTLSGMNALDACETIGVIHTRLRHPALPQLDTASAWLGRIKERLETTPPPLPRRMVTQGLSLTRDLAGEKDVDSQLVHSDLHDANVMSTRRAGSVGGLVAIDPKPLSGTPALTIAPLLWNRSDEAQNAYHLRNHLRFRVDYACDPMGIDPAYARAWSIVRLLDNAWWESENARRHHLHEPDMTKTISIIKAMQG